MCHKHAVMLMHRGAISMRGCAGISNHKISCLQTRKKQRPLKLLILVEVNGSLRLSEALITWLQRSQRETMAQKFLECMSDSLHSSLRCPSILGRNLTGCCSSNYRLCRPWPRVSNNTKDLVRGMLSPDLKWQLTSQQVLDHPWLQNIKKFPNVNLGETVKARIQQFSSVMNKFKKHAL
ncbi:hypothetical protein BS78_K262400 [Paspalum vaginatum]|uniref:Protein kinase domain-containing protein n=1 Tax=Paspalum vaginatum TaxID=158149 RepID=A0A9W7XEA8_9POAL|nr:hypothetical protein BS78_K262400 [Paspalum vaginatum]KAJ1256967.1 hypothetical protein BS78_K262400 [Paspalum vaginatum]